MSSGPPILVTGAHRSGTTWVGKMLALAPGVRLRPRAVQPAHRGRPQPGALRPLLHGRHARERGALPAGAGADDLLPLRPRRPAALAARRGRRRPHRPRRRARRARAADRRTAAGQGPDRAPLGRVARRELRDGRRRADPPPGRASPRASSGSAGSTASRPSSRTARCRRWCGRSRPRSASRPSARARSWRRRRCSGGCSTTPSTATASAIPTGSSCATRTPRSTRSAPSSGSTARLGLELTRGGACGDRAGERAGQPGRAADAARGRARQRRAASAAGASDLTPEEVETLRERTRDVWPRFYSDEDW